jgi:hypothetical protein
LSQACKLRNFQNLKRTVPDGLNGKPHAYITGGKIRKSPCTFPDTFHDQLIYHLEDALAANYKAPVNLYFCYNNQDLRLRQQSSKT